MSLPVLERVERRRRSRRRRRQILRRRATASAVLCASIAAVAWQLWPTGTADSVSAAQAAQTAQPAQAGQSRPTRPAAASHPKPLLSGPPLLESHRFSPALGSRSAILVDADSGRVLYMQRAHTHRPIASTTKIMTALLAFRALKPHDIVVVDPKATRVPLVREGLRANEPVEAWKLFYAMLLYSGNDDALAIAIAAGGSRNKWPFVKEMNAEARKLGLKDTHYSTPSGVIDEDNYSSAWDLAALTRVAMRNPRFRKIVRTKVKHVSWAAPTYSKIYVNNNRLLRTYRGATGVKTGYTHKAGWCLVASATRNGRTLIAVLLNDADMYADAQRLLDLGFAS